MRRHAQTITAHDTDAVPANIQAGNDDYLISIYVCYTQFAFWNENISIAFYDENTQTDDMAMPGGLKPDSNTSNSFRVTLPALGDIRMISLTRTSGLFSQWYIGNVEVERLSNDDKYVFTVNKRINKGKPYRCSEARFATSLPQNDPERQERQERQAEQRMYVYTQRFPGSPVQVKDIPREESFTLSYLSVDFWQQDEYFGRLRLTGANHSVIKLCKSLPEKFNFSEREKNSLEKMLEGRTLETAINDNKLFYVDFEILDGLREIKEGFHLCAPVALFFVNNRDRLMPVAIQLEQEPSLRNPVFFPNDDKYTWMMAKMWFNNSDAAYHQSVAHLGFTHMIMEGFVITTHRNLNHKHPLYKLLLPHFLFLIEINELAMKFLIQPNGWVDKAMNIGQAGMHELVAKKLQTWRLNIDGSLPAELHSRGVLDDVLPHYYYREDSLKLWEIILDYVTRYVTLYYGEKDNASEYLAADRELQGWARAIVAERSTGQGIQGAPGIDENAVKPFLTDHESLCKILTSIIFTSSVIHASVNFMQYDQYGYPPSYPAYLSGVPPTSESHLTEEDVLDALPDFSTSLKIMNITQVLSGFGTHKLGDFPTPYITDKNAIPIVERFQDDLAELSDNIRKANRRRTPVYNHLNPENIPNAISI